MPYASCLSVLYSVPPFRLKAVAGADWVINMLGFGTLTPYAGWAATGLPLGPGRAMVLLAFCPLFAALYPLTQLYQLEEDARRGDRTLALMLGRAAKPRLVALAAAAVAFALFAWRACARGCGRPRGQVAGLDSLALALASGWLLLTSLAAARPPVSPAQHQRGMYQALAAWAVTDVAVVLAWAI